MHNSRGEQVASLLVPYYWIYRHLHYSMIAPLGHMIAPFYMKDRLVRAIAHRLGMDM